TLGPVLLLDQVHQSIAIEVDKGAPRSRGCLAGNDARDPARDPALPAGVAGDRDPVSAGVQQNFTAAIRRCDRALPMVPDQVDQPIAVDIYQGVTVVFGGTTVKRRRKCIQDAYVSLLPRAASESRSRSIT